MNKSNVLKIFGTAMMLLSLASCGEITLRPENKDDKLVTLVDGSELDLTNNNYGVIYDGLVEEGVVNKTVFNDVMFKIAEKQLESYYTGDDKIFEDKAAFDAEVDKLVNEKLYDYISSTSYQVDNHFDESKLVLALTRELYEITPRKYADGREAEYNIGDVVFTPETKASALEEGTLGGGDGTEEGGVVNENDILHYNYKDYKDRVLKREVYTQLLTAKYLEDEAYSSLGRAYSRKVSYIAIANVSEHPGAAKNAIDAFVDYYVSSTDKEVDLNNLAKLWKGVDYSNETGELSTELKQIISDYKLRTLADNIVDEFKKVVEWDDANNTYKKDENGNSIPLSADRVDTTLESSYTGSYSYLPEVGKEKKDIELAQKELVTEGWFIKNGGLTDLPDDIRSRLFDIRTASDFQIIKNKTDEELRGFVREINGVTYLVPAKTQAETSDSDIIIYDRDSDTYYIVIVEDALNTASLNLNNVEKDIKKENPDASEADLANLIKQEKIARRSNAHEVAKMLGTKSSNQSEATIFYLKAANIVFHDEDIYNYFKKNYKDMFDENK